MANKIKKVMLTQPNYSKFGKRSWNLFPYPLAILNACIKDDYDVELFDPNFDNIDDEEIIKILRDSNPDVVGVSTVSTEYIKNIEHMTALVRKALPNTIIVEGGILPTVAPNMAVRDKNVDYWVLSEGEYRFPKLLKALNSTEPDFSEIDGLAYWEEGKIELTLPSGFIEDLDDVPYADYGNLTFSDYANQDLKYAQGLKARRFPYGLTNTARGCVYRCVFCSGPRMSGRRVRMRSSENVLKEIDELYKKGVKEIIFLDDHFLFSRKRAIKIMKGLIERNYDLTWKCVNVTAWLLDEELLDLMKESGCYQLTVSIESGNQYVIRNLVKKPINLEKMPAILTKAKNKGFEIIANFVIGFPRETWSQIRNTFEYAAKLDVDLINFHIATPLPDTELMEECIKGGFVSKDFEKQLANIGYTSGVISTNEFTPKELQIVRAFEWDRINFGSEERRKTIAQIQGITLEELDKWRRETRRKIGVNVVTT